MIDLSGKRLLVFGVAMKTSICWGITQQIQKCGGEVVLASHPSTKKFVDKLASEAGISEVCYCDVTKESELDALFEKLSTDGRPIHGIVHGIAASRSEELQGRYIETSLENFLKTMHVSVFSLTEIAKRAEPLLSEGAGIVTLTFEAAYGYYPHYNVMAVAKAALNASIIPLAVELGERRIRVNAISASPERTPAARGIRDFYLIGAFAEAISPEKRRATIEEIANEAVYLLSPASSGVTGQIRYVDCGASIMRMPSPENARLMEKAMKSIADKFEGIAPQGDESKE